MGLNIELQTESGEMIETVVDYKNVLHRLLPPYGTASCVLSGIDWYGNTVFNRLQVKQFLDEWEELFRKTSDMEEHLLLDGIKRLALRCQDDVHLYLKFIGD
jgi:hypothetical protein